MLSKSACKAFQMQYLTYLSLPQTTTTTITTTAAAAAAATTTTTTTSTILRPLYIDNLR